MFVDQLSHTFILSWTEYNPETGHRVKKQTTG